jgi:hypothetical protein
MTKEGRYIEMKRWREISRKDIEKGRAGLVY